MNDDYSIGNYEKLKAENERLASHINKMITKRDTLRKQLDEARELFNGIERGVLLSTDDEAIDRWLEETK